MGARLAARLNALVDAKAKMGNTTRREILDAAGRAAGISGDTVENIINQGNEGSINCPPLNRMQGFARYFNVPLGSLIGAANRDGCNYDTAEKQVALKREIPQSTRADLDRGSFVFPETRSFPIIKPEDVKAAVSSWGRASTVRARGYTFDDFKRRLTAMAKRKGTAFVAALPADWKSNSEKSFHVFKDADGRYRWVMVSSSAFVDRDGEIVSTKALENAVAEHDRTGERGTLRWWHLPGVDLGQADFGMLQGRMLIESGTFISEAVGEAIAQKSAELEGSLGFKHPVTEPVNGVFENIKIFERSLLPRGRASNLFTSLNVTKESKTMSAEKIEALKGLLGEDAANDILAQAEQTEKGAEAQGFTYKSHDELATLGADALLEYALNLKEHEEAEAQKAKEAEGKTYKASEIMPLLENIMTKLEEQAATIKELQAAATKEAPTQQQPQPEPDALQAISERLKALESDQPPALKQGYRASHSGPVIEDEAKEELSEREKAAKELQETHPELGPFADLGVRMGAWQPHPYWGAPPSPNNG